MLKYNSHLKPHSRRLRSGMTDSERLLWSRLRGKQLLNVQFYRQKPIGEYIVDFYAPRARLILEVDGSQHLHQDHIANDARRDDWLCSQGLEILRFTNLEVLNELDAVVSVVLETLNELMDGNPPNPPLRKGGLGTSLKSASRWLRG